MQNKKVKHRPSTKYLYLFIKLQARTCSFLEKNRKIKKCFFYLPTKFFLSMFAETHLCFTPYPQHYTKTANMLSISFGDGFFFFFFFFFCFFFFFFFFLFFFFFFFFFFFARLSILNVKMHLLLTSYQEQFVFLVPVLCFQMFTNN